MTELLREMLEHPLFKDLNIGNIEKLANCASEKDFGAGSVIFEEGGEADRLYLIRSGKVAIDLPLPNRNPLTIYTIEGGGVVGWSWLFPPYKWHFQARATEPTQTILIDSKCIMDLCKKDHSFGYEMMQRVSHLILERLEGTTQQLVNSFDVP